MSATRLYVCTNCDWKGQRRLDIPSACPECEAPTERYEASDRSWRQRPDATCKLCRQVPAALDNGYCLDCFWLCEIKPRLELRTNLLLAQSENETILALLVQKMAPTGRLPNGTYRSILHKCSCGHVEATWLALHAHLQASGPGHTYVLHGEPVASKRGAKRPVEDVRNAWVEDTEGLL